MAKKLLRASALLTTAILPACTITTGNPPFDDPDADPCPPLRDAGNPPWWPDAPDVVRDAATVIDAAAPPPDAAPRDTPDAQPPIEDARPGGDARPTDYVDADPCDQGLPDGAVGAR